MEKKDQTAPSLSQRSFSALKWNYLGAFARMGLQFAIGIVLARLLGPEPFGLVAVASLALGLGALFADFGLASALIQQKEILPRDIRYVFTLQWVFALTLTVVLEFSAPLIANFFHRPDAVPILQAMFLSFFIAGLGQTAAALLRRELDFRRTQIAQIASYLLGYLALGVPLALYGFGVWSLVVAHLAQSGLFTVFAYAMTRHPILPCLSSSGGRSLLHFGVKVTATNLSNWGLACFDSVMAGRAFGVTELGLYNRTFSLVAMPTYNLVSSLQGVLFSASARAQDNKPRLLQTYLAGLGVMGFICLPMFSVVAVIPKTMITGVYGTQWLPAIALLTPLALAMPFSALLGLGGPVMTATGNPGRELSNQFYSLIVFVLALWWASHYSIEVVAWSVFAAYVLRFILITNATLSVLSGSWKSVVEVLTGPAALATVCAAATFALDTGLRAVTLPDPLRLALVGCAGAVLAILGFLFGQRWFISKPVAQFIRQLTPSLPLRLQRLVLV